MVVGSKDSLRGVLLICLGGNFACHEVDVLVGGNGYSDVLRIAAPHIGGDVPLALGAEPADPLVAAVVPPVVPDDLLVCFAVHRFMRLDGRSLASACPTFMELFGSDLSGFPRRPDRKRKARPFLVGQFSFLACFLTRRGYKPTPAACGISYISWMYRGRSFSVGCKNAINNCLPIHSIL